MKLSELKTRLKNKYVVRIVAGVLTIALLGSSMTAVAVQADQKKDAAVQTEQKEDSSDKKDDIEDLLQVSVSDKEIGKDENVYLISDATGSVYDTIVTDHLINKNQSATLEDQSNLTDIKNVKGSEEFSQNGEKLTWQADGNDIYILAEDIRSANILKYDGSDWKNLGECASGSSGIKTSIAAYDGTSYVLIADYSSGQGRTILKKYNNGVWQQVDVIEGYTALSLIHI